MELTGQLGYLGHSSLDRGLASGMVFLGLHYQSDFESPHRFYFEGGYKNWYKTDTGPGLGGDGQTFGDFPTPAKDNWGLREAYYDFDGGQTKVTGGLHTASLGETLLLDERAVGLSFQRELGPVQFQMTTGSVMTRFARMKDFCATRHVYRVVRGGRINYVGDGFGETNFLGGTVSWSPSGGATSDDLAGEEEEDEFGAFEELSSFEESEEGLVRRVGAVFFEEFGSAFLVNQLYYGGLAELNLWSDLELELELIHQHVADHRVLGYMVQGQKDFTWKSGAFTAFRLGYIGSAEVDPDARFRPTFSNLFLGEVMRLDVANMPLVFGRLKHTLTWRGRPSIGFFAVAQTSATRAEEYDLELDVHLTRGLRLYGVVGFVRAESLPSSTTVARAQFRYAF